MLHYCFLLGFRVIQRKQVEIECMVFQPAVLYFLSDIVSVCLRILLHFFFYNFLDLIICMAGCNNSQIIAKEHSVGSLVA